MGTSKNNGNGVPAFPGVSSSPKMMFVELNQSYCQSSKKKKVWTKGDTDQLGLRLKEQLISGGLDADMYSIEDYTLLAKCESKDAKAVKNFLLTQGHISKVTLDSKDYYPKVNSNKKTAKKKKTKKLSNPNEEL